MGQYWTIYAKVQLFPATCSAQRTFTAGRPLYLILILNLNLGLWPGLNAEAEHK
jgi:hypothetical protein